MPGGMRQKGPLSPGYPPLSKPLKRKGLETDKRAGQNVRVKTYGKKRRTTRRVRPSPPSRSEGAAMILDHAMKL